MPETLAQVFSYEICEISKNTFFTERIRTAASKEYSAFKNLSKISREQASSVVIIVLISEKN